MSGGYINCADFTGDDKSCSAISGVFEELPSVLPEFERDVFVAEVIQPLQDQLEETGEYFLINQATSERLLRPVDMLYEEYRKRFGDSEVWDAVELDHASGMNPVQAKWGAGPGWRYYCLTDLRKGLRRSIETGADVCISFD